MSNTLIRHADVITLNAARQVLRAADVAVSGPTIVAVGSVPADFRADEVIEAGGHILLPGLFNAHVHTSTTLLRGRVDYLAPEAHFDERDWALAAGLSGDDAYWSAALAAAEMIRGGTVGFADHSFFMERVAQAVVESGLRANLAWAAYGHDGGEVGTDLAGLASFAQEWQGAAEGRITTMLGPFSSSACSPQFLARTAAVAIRLGTGVHVRLSESRREVETSLAENDLTPVEVLNRTGILDSPTIAAHAAHLIESDCEILAAKHATVAYCPVHQFRLGMGPTPVSDLQARGVAIALGTDGPPGNDALNVWQEMRAAMFGQQRDAKDPPAALAQDILVMATQGGARAMGFTFSGAIAPGHSADLILVDGRTAHLLPRPDLVYGLVQGAEGGDVSHVMVAGRWLMRQRELLTLDVERIGYEAEKRSLRLGRRGGPDRLSG